MVSKSVGLFSLNNNKLSQIDSQLFRNLTNLRILELESNELISIERKAFDCLVNLNFLNLGHNRIEKLNKSHFKNLESIEFVNLSFVFGKISHQIKSYYNSNSLFIFSYLKKHRKFGLLKECEFNWDVFLLQFDVLNTINLNFYKKIFKYF